MTETFDYSTLETSDIPIPNPDATTSEDTESKNAVQDFLKKTSSKPAAKKPRAPRAKRPAEPAAKKDEFVEPMTQLYALIGLGVGMKDDVCGPAIVAAAPDIAVEWQKLAESDPNVRRALRSLTRSSAWGGLIMAHVPIAMMIARHHMPALYGPLQSESSDESVSDPSN